MKYTPKPVALGVALLLITGAVAVIEFGPLGAAGPTDTSAGNDAVAASGATSQQTPAQTAAGTTGPATGSGRERGMSGSSNGRASGSDERRSSAGTDDVLPRAERIERKSANFSRAPEIVNPTGFINTGGEEISINEYVGEKVILVEFWTYSCINCKHTHPHVNEWHRKYADDGLLIIGVHTPEFAFEKDRSNVEEAVREANIEYPVVLDNDAATWRAYGNHYWPHRYLIGVDGFIRYDHIGEGAYDETERKIQQLLDELHRVQNARDERTPSVGNRTQADPTAGRYGHQEWERREAIEVR